LFGEKIGRPNVYYEYGLIEGKNKKAIVICNKMDWDNIYKKENIFSDKGSSTYCIRYDDHKKLAEDVEKELIKKVD
jgi:hypothetical protein